MKEPTVDTIECEGYDNCQETRVVLVANPHASLYRSSDYNLYNGLPDGWTAGTSTNSYIKHNRVKFFCPKCSERCAAETTEILAIADKLRLTIHERIATDGHHYCTYTQTP